MNLKRILIAILCLLPSTAAHATISASYPYNLQNGQTADATQVMSNFDQIQNDVNSNAAHNGANVDITSLTGLSTPLGIAYGGTGSATASGARSDLGLGASAIENLGAAIIDDGSGNLTIGATAVTSAMLSTTIAIPSAATATTQAINDSSTKIATTAFVLNQAASKSELQTATSATKYVPPSQVQNHPGVAKAWVDFTVSGTTVTVQQAYNATVSRTSNGLYRVTVTTNFADTHYGYSVSGGIDTAGSFFTLGTLAQTPNKTTAHVDFQFLNTTNAADDPSEASIILYGTQ